MTNYLLKFEHSNGSNVWFTVYCDRESIFECVRAIEKRTSFKFLNDYTDMGS